VGSEEEGVDRDSIDRIRSATFPVGRRGYEKREVDRFLKRILEEARAEAKRIVDEANQRRADIEAVI
jgi:DivIVA domain-containing protein